MNIVLGAIADDFTGATDLANNLVRAGMRTLQVIGVPDTPLLLEDVDAVIVALKSRSCEAAQAVSQSLEALEWLQARGVRQVFFKYCSTFDSTAVGNIGPVADALLESLGARQTVMVPAFPVNRRTVYQGHLFVGDRLLNESGMEQHPLNPMTDADLVRVLAQQSKWTVGLLNHSVLKGGADAARAHLDQARGEGCSHIICDSLDEDDLQTVAEAVVDFPLVTGGSGLGQALPAEYRKREWLSHIADASQLEPASGSALVLSGSCSRATLAQIDAFLTHYEGFALDPLALATSDDHYHEALNFARNRVGCGAPLIVYASALAGSVQQAQQQLGVEASGELVESALASLATTLVSEGVGRLIVAGGETSGAVVSALGIKALRIGGQIDPGVPWTQARIEGKDKPLSLALKSGNFGAVNFFTRAFEVLQ